MVDSAQYQARQADFDFDLISMALLVLGDADARRASTASSIRAPRRLPGSRNLPGTADPAVDALIDAVGAADRPRRA